MSGTQTVKRVSPPATPDPVVISRKDFKEDLAQGFCVTESAPERVEKIRNVRNGTSLERKLPAEHVLRCMVCQFDTIHGNVTKEAGTGKIITGLDIMGEHLSKGQHSWPYCNPFTNPYGNVHDVVIEGMTMGQTYDEFLKAQSASPAPAPVAPAAPAKEVK